MTETTVVQEGILEGAVFRRAGDLAQPVEALNPGHTNLDVIEHFRANAALACVPIEEGGYPIGLINRGIFLTGFSLPFRHEVYDRKSCIAFMDKNPLVVDAEVSLPDLGRLVVEAGTKVLQDGFIVTREGRYLGLGTGLDLLRSLGILEAERTQTIRESLGHARAIQRAVLETSGKELAAGGLRDHHLVWEPRDGVGGDFFFARRIDRDGRLGTFLALMDCTGHGVPGAFTAMLMNSFLGHALDMAPPWEPGQVLAVVNRRVKENLGQPCHALEDRAFEMLLADEGMDVTCLWLDAEDPDLFFSGARQSLWVFRPGAAGPEEIKGERIGVGYCATPDDHVWESLRVPLGPGTTLVCLTDGIVDQIGGPSRLAFGRRRLWEAFADPSGRLTLQERLQGCLAALARYQGVEERRDDVSLLALAPH